MTIPHTIRVPLRSEGDGLFDVDFGGWKQRGWTIHPWTATACSTKRARRSSCRRKTMARRSQHDAAHSNSYRVRAAPLGRDVADLRRLVWADMALSGLAQLSFFSLCIFGLMVWLLDALWKPVLDDMETQSNGS